jgi:hypothetical protein
MSNFYVKNKLILFFFVSHFIFAIFLGPMFAFAPDEQGYLYTFNNVYSLPIGSYDLSETAWFATPIVFLWIMYLPVKVISLLGVPDYLSIRLLSIAITTCSLFLLLKINQNMQKSRGFPQKVIFSSFFIPSVFLWTSLGLREAFIIFEITLFLVGLNALFLRKNKKAVFFLFAGSYGLVSTKPYLWVLLVITLIVFIIVVLIRESHRKHVIRVTVAGFIAPFILYSGTSSPYALSFIFNSSITEAGSRSGDSITQYGNFIIRGDYSLFALNAYLAENPDSIFSRAFATLNLDDRVESLWNEKLQAKSISQTKKVEKEKFSINSDVLKPGLITEPWTMLWPAFVFIAGPFPFVGEPTVAANIASLESPIWWLLYGLVIYQFYMFRKFKLFRDPAILFTLIFLAGEIAFSSLVEVNLGTSFRHRSILLVPLVFLYVRITQRAHELSNTDSKQIS